MNEYAVSKYKDFNRQEKGKARLIYPISFKSRIIQWKFKSKNIKLVTNKP